MRQRKARLEIINEILTHNVIGSQDELLRQLALRGINITQATLSRDLKRLNTHKVSTDLGGYRYIVDHNSEVTGEPFAKTRSTDQSSRHPAALSIDISCNLIVIKTRIGFASGLAYDIDMLHSPLILGTIPGSDTVFAVCAENARREDIFELLSTILPSEVMEKASPRFVGGCQMCD